MNNNKPNFVGVDLFAGAGGLSLGAQMAGIEVALAVEKEMHAAATYMRNHPKTTIINDDISNIHDINIAMDTTSTQKVLFGGPPCQGFSTSNQKTRNKANQSNWLLKEFIRIMSIWKPDWVVFENVCGFINTEKKLFLNTLLKEFEEHGYTCTWYVLNSAEFGVPQRRQRFFLIASRHGHKLSRPHGRESALINVEQAISDLPSLLNGAKMDYLEYKCDATNDYSRFLRKDLRECTGHLVTRNSEQVVKRYQYVPQGGNWRNIPGELMKNYTDRTRCHTGIYHRLNPKEPALTIGNYRKAMLIHPWENRGLSVREAARIQSFPDDYEFKGSLGFQQQQVGNAVPPLLAKAVFNMITNGEY